MTQRFFALLVLVGLPATLAAQQRPLPLKRAPAATSVAITAADLMTRLYIFADDSMMGREAGTAYHDKAVEYIARETERIGLRPGGDDGTFFQRIPLVTRNLPANTTITVAGKAFMAWTDFLPRDNGPSVRSMRNTPAVYGGVYGDTARMVSPELARGKVVVFSVPTGWRANPGLLTQRYRGAIAIALATLDSMPPSIQQELARPRPDLKESGPMPALPPVPAFFYSTRAMADAMLGAAIPGLRRGAAGLDVTGELSYVEGPAPGARNVIAILAGSDPILRNQYVALGAHSDHVGFAVPVDHDSLYAFYHIVRPQGADDGIKPATADDWPRVRALLDSLRRAHSPRLDSIFNGADDDGSGSMALLEVAEALAKMPAKPKRSVVFVWHVAEERGLWGSQHFTDHPTVPRDSIVAQINIDMIGRGSAADTPGGGPGYLQLIGARRLSTELGDILEAEGRKTSPPFKFDYQYDADGHPQQFYCRSDHYMYARYGIPVVFMSTGGHPEYHQVTDEPQYIDYDQLARVTNLVLNATQTIANLDHRLVVDRPKPNPREPCRQ